MQEGYAFFNKAIGRVPRHLNFVLGEHPKTGEMLVVNLTTGSDGTGTIYIRKDWDRIVRPSRLAIGMARVVTHEAMMDLIDRYLIQTTEAPPRRTLLMMRDEFLRSAHAQTSLKAFLRECM